MLKFLVFVSLIGGLMSYYSLDPMKSSFFLIGTMLFIMPVCTMIGSVWYSYFVSLLFLSGIFVILVYFSSLSSFGNMKVRFFVLLMLMSFLMISFSLSELKMLVGLNVFYYELFWFIIMYVLLMLLFFMNFTSYFLSFSGALRKL